jgi:hypothetical protein
MRGGADVDLSLSPAVREGVWFAPGKSARLDGEVLIVAPSPFLSDRTVVHSGPAILPGFLALWSASDVDVLRYVRDWGLLHLCDHGLPADHPPDGLPTAIGLWRSRDLVPGPCASEWREPLSAWRYWSRQAASLVNIGTALRNSRHIDPRDVARLFEPAPWAAAGGMWAPDPPTRLWGFQQATSDYLEVLESRRAQTRARVAERPISTQEARELLHGATSFWLEEAAVRMQLAWVNGRPEVQLSGGLFGSIGTHVLMAIAGSQGFAVCHGCGAAHVPARPSDTKRASYCPDCRARRVPQRDAQRRYQARRRASETER